MRTARSRWLAAMAIAASTTLALATTEGNPTETYIYGGPGSLEGTFQDAVGQIDRQGWTGLVCAEGEEAFYWQVSDFKADNLNSHGPGNQAIWAGQTAEQQPGWTQPPGYGNLFDTRLLWSATAPTTAPFTVDLEFYYNTDLEPSYDFLGIEWNRGGAWTALQWIDGSTRSGPGVFDPPGVLHQQSWLVDPIDLVGPASDELQLRLRVTSDGLGSNEDGFLITGNTSGGAQIDDISVAFDGVPVNGGGDADGIATFEAGDDEGWTPQPEVCSCTLISTLDTDLDPNVDNETPQLALLQSPGAWGRSTCLFSSPQIPWTVAGGESLDGATLRFDTYSTSAEGVGTWWVYVRHVVSGVQENWDIVLGPEPNTGGLWQSYEVDLTGIVPLDAESVQVRWRSSSGTSQDFVATFDNVTLSRFDTSATATPAAAGRIELASPRPNPSNPGATVRYSVPTAGTIRLELFDLRGRRVRSLVDRRVTPGQHTAYFDGRDDKNRPVASGVYLVRLIGLGEVQTRRLTVVR